MFFKEDGHKKPKFIDPSNIKTITQEYPNYPCIGVYNFITKQVYLFPAMQEKVWLLKNNQGLYETGWSIESKNGKFIRGIEIDKKKILEYNKSTHLVPRMYSSSEHDDGSYMTSHEWCIEKLNEEKNIDNYYGFSLTTGNSLNGEPKFVWVSGSLNNRNEHGKLARSGNGTVIRRQGMLVPESMQAEIKDKVLEALKPPVPPILGCQIL